MCLVPAWSRGARAPEAARRRRGFGPGPRQSRKRREAASWREAGFSARQSGGLSKVRAPSRDRVDNARESRYPGRGSCVTLCAEGRWSRMLFTGLSLFPGAAAHLDTCPRPGPAAPRGAGTGFRGDRTFLWDVCVRSTETQRLWTLRWQRLGRKGDRHWGGRGRAALSRGRLPLPAGHRADLLLCRVQSGPG